MSIDNSKKTKLQFFAGALVIFMVITVVVSSVVLFTGGSVNAAGEETAVTETTEEVKNDSGSDNGAGLAYISAALSTGLACIGAGIAVAITGSAALGAISEDPKLLGKTLIFVGLSEGIAIYGLIISIMILNKV